MQQSLSPPPSHSLSPAPPCQSSLKTHWGWQVGRGCQGVWASQVTPRPPEPCTHWGLPHAENSVREKRCPNSDEMADSYSLQSCFCRLTSLGSSDCALSDLHSLLTAAPVSFRMGPALHPHLSQMEALRRKPAKATSLSYEQTGRFVSQSLCFSPHVPTSEAQGETRWGLGELEAVRRGVVEGPPGRCGCRKHTPLASGSYSLKKRRQQERRLYPLLRLPSFPPHFPSRR